MRPACTAGGTKRPQCCSGPSLPIPTCRFHHYYKSPVPFDDLFIHPAEAFGYYIILYCPAFVAGRMPLAAFFAYMGVCGVCGVCDHSGIALRAPMGLYDTREHDLHHSAVRVNFGFPTALLDRLHGTYQPP